MSTEVFSNAAAASGLRRSSRLLAVSVSNVETNLASINTRKLLKRKKDDVSPAEVESMPLNTKRRRATSRKPGTDITDSQDSVKNPPRSKRKNQPKPEPVYDIPDVEKRETSFRGRLGKEFLSLSCDFIKCFLSEGMHVSIRSCAIRSRFQTQSLAQELAGTPFYNILLSRNSSMHIYTPELIPSKKMA
jgi:hypothetical protein